MSVPNVKRNESTIQFIETERQLELCILRHAESFSKKHAEEIEYLYIERIWALLAKYSISLLNNVIAANKVFIIKQEDVDRRKELFDEALLLSPSITAQINILKEIHPQTKSGTITKINDLAEQEKKTKIVKLSSCFEFMKIRYFVTDSGKIIKKI